MTDIYPCVRYRDAATGLRWLQTVLGATEHAVMRNDDGSIGHAELAFGDGYIMAGGPPTEPYASAVGKLGPAETYLAVDDAKAAYERAVSAGAEVLMPFEDQGYGVGFTLRDPEGNIWSMGDYRPG